MSKHPTYAIHFLVLLLGLIVCFIVNISLGSVSISVIDTLKVIFDSDFGQSSNSYIIWNYRIPKALTAVLVGSGLSLSGLLMQTLFRNPLAGPYVLGISSGASLGAALLIMGSSLFSGFMTFSAFNDIALAVASSVGSFLVLLIVLTVAVRVKDTMALLIIGLMFGSITAALVSVLSYFTKAEKLQQYVYWSFGSLGNLSWTQLAILCLCTFIGIILSILSIKSLNAFLLGENYAKSLGIQLKKSRYMIIIATGLLAGCITAFAGPIAFIGLAVPHLTRQLFHTTDHKILIPASLSCGAILILNISDLSVGYDKKVVAKNISFDLKKGELVAIVGINGIGKSTLLRTIGGFQSKISGSIQIEGKELASIDTLDLATKISVVLTEPIASKNMSIKELLALGRQPYTNWLGKLSADDISFITKSVSLLELEPFLDKKCYELSDGQLQRVMIARALVQDTSIILLDEPTTHLDLYHKVQILKLLKSIAHKTEKTILFTSHEIELAIQLCDKMLILDGQANPFEEPCKLIEHKNFETLFPADMISFDANSGSFKIKN